VVNSMPSAKVTAYRNGKPFKVTVVAALDRFYLDQIAATKLEEMRDDATIEKVRIRLRAGFRTRKQLIEEFGFSKKKVEKNELPADVIALQNARSVWFSFKTPEEKRWIEANAGKFGFCRTLISNDQHYEYRPNKEGCLDLKK
jgi:LAS superfamily LD-carboxypeptidase LdcB